MHPRQQFTRVPIPPPPMPTRLALLPSTPYGAQRLAGVMRAVCRPPAEDILDIGWVFLRNDVERQLVEERLQRDFRHHEIKVYKASESPYFVRLFMYDNMDCPTWQTIVDTGGPIPEYIVSIPYSLFTKAKDIIDHILCDLGKEMDWEPWDDAYC
ncbi:hypothetical protein O9K51_08799 [Purpureocillium lavendulum]|uniref:Uncharacterized protein n=1 Tax=Purpureocillium lavendulum TaxID=1247861 RepID=A0AB34FFJ4_9HYPO|nr:hypothetical protein O9K51_08799 [Purpureocillium lavendulum]